MSTDEGALREQNFQKRLLQMPSNEGDNFLSDEYTCTRDAAATATPAALAAAAVALIILSKLIPKPFQIATYYLYQSVMHKALNLKSHQATL